MKRTTLKALALALLLLAPGAPPRAQTDDRGASIWKAVGELPAGPKRWALVVGVDEYHDPKFNNLSGAANDARSLADALTRYAGFPGRQVTLLATDEPGRQPTRANILKRLDDLIADAPKDGLLLLFFAGHGLSADKGRTYLLPSDAWVGNDPQLLEKTALNVEAVRDSIRKTGVRQVIVILDACRNEPLRARSAAANVLTEAYTRAFDFDVRNREVVAFATIYATAVGQRAYEDGDRRQGYFTRALVEGMSGGAKNGRGEVTLAALVDYVQRRVPELVGRALEQKPWAEIDGYLAHRLVVAVAGPPPAEPDPATRPAEPTDLGGGSTPPAGPPAERLDPGGLSIYTAQFDCYSNGACHLFVGGSGWGVEGVKVFMNGRDVSKQLLSNNGGVMQLDGDVRSLNLISGTNEVQVQFGGKTSEPYRFFKLIK